MRNLHNCEEQTENKNIHNKYAIQWDIITNAMGFSQVVRCSGCLVKQITADGTQMPKWHSCIVHHFLSAPSLDHYLVTCLQCITNRLF